MVFDINGKVALVTGGAAGIGLHYAKDLLKNGVKGVTLADVNPKAGKAAVEELEKEFGSGKVIFVETDVRKREQMENAFQKTVDTFKYVDILINNAGILDDSRWETQIEINLNGAVHGIILATEKFMTKYKQGHEAVIVNLASTAAWDYFPNLPVYSATKAAAIALTKAWGVPHFYNKWNIRLVALCPGVTNTDLIANIKGRNLGDAYEELLVATLDSGILPTQPPSHVSKEAMRIIKYAPNGTTWVIEGGEPAYEVIPVDRQTCKNNVLKEE